MYRKTYHSSRWTCGRLCKKLQKIKEENKTEVRLQVSECCLFELLIVRKLSSVSKQTDECCMHTMNDKVVASMKTSVTILVRKPNKLIVNYYQSNLVNLPKFRLSTWDMHEYKTVSDLCQVKQPFSTCGNYAFRTQEFNQQRTIERPLTVKWISILWDSLARFH